MKKYLALLSLSICCVFAACNQTGEPVEYAKACSTENDKKYIEVSGYLDDKGSLFCSNIGGGPVRCGFKLLETPDGEKGFTADIEAGTGGNSAEKPERGYKKEDLKVRDNGGNLLSLADKVKLTGKMNTTQDGSVCYLTVTKIEKQ